MAFGGFASVAAVLDRPLTDVKRQRFLAILFLALTQVVSSLAPAGFARVLEDTATLWVASSALYLFMAVVVIATTVIRPIVEMGRLVHVISPMITVLLNAMAIISVVLLPINMFNSAIGPSFEVYYLSLLLAFIPGFLLFADVVLNRDSI